MELSSWGSVQEMIDALGVLDMSSIKTALFGVASALYVCHTKDIVHRNVKPSAMLVGAGGNIKLGGFGLSAQMNMQARLGTFCGTPRFLAPEIVVGSTYTSAVDIWALGASAYAMATGHALFHELTPMRAMYQVARLTAPPPMPEIQDKALVSFITACLTIAPERRPRAGDLLTATFLRARRNE